MPDITTDQLQSISIAAVENFLNDRVPLSQGIAKQASLHDLNSEQIQRTIEAANSITYLKLLKVAEDRTFEFPLAKYQEVLAAMVTPDFTKQASISSPGDSALVKTASAVEPESSYSPYASMGRTEAYSMLTKLAAENSRALDVAKDNLYMAQYELEKAAAAFSKDPRANEKMQTIGSLEKVASDVQLGSYIFKEGDLSVARKVVELEKTAAALTKEISERQTMMSKSAGLISSIGHGVGWLAAKPFGMAAKGFGGLVKNTVGGGIDAVKGVSSKVTGKAAPGKVVRGIGIGGASMAALNTGTDALMYQPKDASNIYHTMKNSGPY